MLPILNEALTFLQAVLIAGWNRRQSVLNLVTFALVVVFSWQWWFANEGSELVLFVGSPGSSSAAAGPRLLDEIADTDNAQGVKFKIEMEQVPANSSILEQMSFESDRIPLGFVQDSSPSPGDDSSGKGDLQALVPLEWQYLFVLCRTEFLNDIATWEAGESTTADKLFAPVLPGLRSLFGGIGRRPPEEYPHTLAEVIKYFVHEGSKGQVFLGPKKSATNEMAKVALRQYCKPDVIQSVEGINDWEALKQAFREKKVDLAFYAGPIGNDYIKDLANDGHVVLLGLGDITSAIQYEGGFEFYHAVLPANLYRAKEHVHPHGNEDEEAPVAFCRKGLSTIAGRGVLACPRSVSTADAYVLAAAARAALEDNGFNINLNADDPPLQSDVKATRMRMPAHPGLELLRNGKSPNMLRDPTTWPAWLQSAASISLGMLVIPLLQWLTRKVSPGASPSPIAVEPTVPVEPSVRPAAPAAAPALASEQFMEFDRTLTEWQNQIDDQTFAETAAESSQWDGRLRDLRRRIRHADKLSADEQEELLKRHDLLATDIAQSTHWLAKPSPSRPKKTTSPQEQK
jgi:hypothetical protein